MRPGFNVWPPKTLADEADEFAGDHYAQDWDEVLERVNSYVAAIGTGAAPTQPSEKE